MFHFIWLFGEYIIVPHQSRSHGTLQFITATMHTPLQQEWLNKNIILIMVTLIKTEFYSRPEHTPCTTLESRKNARTQHRCINNKHVWNSFTDAIKDAHFHSWILANYPQLYSKFVDPTRRLLLLLLVGLTESFYTTIDYQISSHLCSDHVAGTARLSRSWLVPATLKCEPTFYYPLFHPPPQSHQRIYPRTHITCCSATTPATTPLHFHQHPLPLSLSWQSPSLRH